MLLKLFDENEEEILAAMHTDLHRNSFEGFVYDVAVVKKDIKELIHNLPSWSTPRCFNRALVSLFSRGYIVPQPYGVALIIGTWNYPFMLCIMPLAAALAAGNVVVVKPSNVSPTCSKLITRLLRKYMDPTYDSFFVFILVLCKSSVLKSVVIATQHQLSLKRSSIMSSSLEITR